MPTTKKTISCLMHHTLLFIVVTAVVFNRRQKMVRIKFDNLIRVPICVYTETSQLPNGPDIDLIFFGFTEC